MDNSRIDIECVNAYKDLKKRITGRIVEILKNLRKSKLPDVVTNGFFEWNIDEKEDVVNVGYMIYDDWNGKYNSETITFPASRLYDGSEIKKKAKTKKRSK